MNLRELEKVGSSQINSGLTALSRVNPVKINRDSVYLIFLIKHKIPNGIRQTFQSCNTHERDDLFTFV